MGCLKSQCWTSYNSSVETIALNCLFFWRKSRFCTHFGDRRTNGGQPRCIEALSLLASGAITRLVFTSVCRRNTSFRLQRRRSTAINWYIRRVFTAKRRNTSQQLTRPSKTASQQIDSDVVAGSSARRTAFSRWMTYASKIRAPHAAPCPPL